jgi:hypothetical protein
MAGSKLVGVDKVNEVGEVREWQEGDPKPFVLRGNAECEQLLATLDSLGVTYFDYIYWRDQAGTDGYCTWPSFKKNGVRFSAKRLQSVRRAQGELSIRLRYAVEQSLEGTYEEDADLMVCFSVSVCQERSEISAHIKVIEAFYRCNDDYAVELL